MCSQWNYCRIYLQKLQAHKQTKQKCIFDITNPVKPSIVGQGGCRPRRKCMIQNQQSKAQLKFPAAGTDTLDVF